MSLRYKFVLLLFTGSQVGSRWPVTKKQDYIFSNQWQIPVNIIALVPRAKSEDPGNEYVSSHALCHVMFLPEYSVITCPVLDCSDVTDVAEWDRSVSVGFKNDPASAER